MASNSLLGSDVAGIPSMNIKEKMCLLKRSWKYVVEMKWDKHILLCQRNMVSENRLHMTSCKAEFKVRID